MSLARTLFGSTILATALALALTSAPAEAQTDDDARLTEAAAVLRSFTTNDERAIPTELLQRARGIAIVPNLFRGGFIIGARRGQGVLVVRHPTGVWGNPAFINLTGGSAGAQIGAESTDLVLVFANDNAIKDMQDGKFTLGGDATAVAGPVGRNATAALTFRAEVYGYAESRGLFAGAAFEGARLAIDEDRATRYYARRAAPFEPQSAGTPQSARSFLATVAEITAGFGAAAGSSPAPAEEAQTFPLE